MLYLHFLFINYGYGELHLFLRFLGVQFASSKSRHSSNPHAMKLRIRLLFENQRIFRFREWLLDHLERAQQIICAHLRPAVSISSAAPIRTFPLVVVINNIITITLFLLIISTR